MRYGATETEKPLSKTPFRGILGTKFICIVSPPKSLYLNGLLYRGTDIPSLLPTAKHLKSQLNGTKQSQLGNTFPPPASRSGDSWRRLVIDISPLVRQH